MKNLFIFLYEGKHFLRSPFKLLALLLFVIAGVYGLHQGEEVYRAQRAEVQKTEQMVQEERQANIKAYRADRLVPEDRKRANLSEPLWAIEHAWVYHCKSPSPAMVYSIGQSEQYGFCKKITRWASPYDKDLAAEIANPERLQTGTLDFSFVLLFLSPLLLLVLTYNLKSEETERGFMSLVEVQYGSITGWLLSRMLFYVLLLALTTGLLITYGALRTHVLTEVPSAYGQMLLYSFAYLGLWSILYFGIVRLGTSIMGNTLRMVGLYFLLAFVIPAAVYQYLSIIHPVNLMTEYVDARLDKRWDLWEQPGSVRQEQIGELFPEIVGSPVSQDSTKLPMAIRESTSALSNQLRKESIRFIEQENQTKNAFIEGTFWFNPISFFQNRFNAIAQTHFDDYQAYRDEIQHLVDVQIRLLVSEMWADKTVDEAKYVEYYQILTGEAE